jgi:signal transduction histidine kinase
VSVAPSEALHLLLVEDDEVDRMAVRRVLRQASVVAKVEEVVDFSSAREALLRSKADCILLDFHLPGGDGLELMQSAAAAGMEAPIIVLTGQGDETLAVELMKAGAVDYLPKRMLTSERLSQSIRQAIRVSQAERRAKQASRLRDDTLAIVSHDLRNPLGVVEISAGLLRKAVEGTPNAVLVQRIDRAVKRMSRLIDDLLCASRIDSGSLAIQPERVGAATLVAEAVELFAPLAEARRCKLIAEQVDGSVQVLADRERMNQVFSNVLGNALKYVSEETGRIRISFEKESEKARFSIHDNGSGIDAASLPHLFERGWKVHQAERDGAGLGLYIAKGIVEAHCGAITVESTPGTGTTVRFWLPVAP